MLEWERAGNPCTEPRVEPASGLWFVRFPLPPLHVLVLQLSPLNPAAVGSRSLVASILIRATMKSSAKDREPLTCPRGWLRGLVLKPRHAAGAIQGHWFNHSTDRFLYRDALTRRRDVFGRMRGKTPGGLAGTFLRSEKTHVVDLSVAVRLSCNRMVQRQMQRPANGTCRRTSGVPRGG